jgi:hypothetical protein
MPAFHHYAAEAQNLSGVSAGSVGPERLSVRECYNVKPHVIQQ